MYLCNSKTLHNYIQNRPANISGAVCFVYKSCSLYCLYVDEFVHLSMASLNEQMLDAAIANDLATVQQLVSQGADINYTERFGNCAVFTAAWEGNIAALELYHSLGAIVDIKGDNNPLCNAAFNGKATSVKWLLEKGADPNFTFATGENALHYTICKTSEPDERAEIVRLLLQAGTYVHQTTIKGMESVCFMRDAFLKGETPLHRAAAYGNETIIRLLLDAGADPSVKDANGDTPISWGSWHLRESAILKLLWYKGVARVW